MAYSQTLSYANRLKRCSLSTAVFESTHCASHLLVPNFSTTPTIPNSIPSISLSFMILRHAVRLFFIHLSV